MHLSPERTKWITCIGVSVFVCLCAFFTVPVVGVLAVAVQRGQLDIIPVQWLYLILPLLIIIFPFVFFGLALSALFTQIRITSEGIEYESFLQRGIIKVEEIEAVTRSQWNKSIKLLVIRRAGATWLRPRGLVFQFVHGIWFGIAKPVIVLWNVDQDEENQILGLKIR